MSGDRWFKIGIWCFIASFVLGIAGWVTKSDIEKVIKDNYQAIAADQYACDNSTETERFLRDQISPEAEAHRSGVAYLRYPNNVVRIEQQGSGQPCVIYVEDLGRVNNGHYVFLGTGFRPGSPSSSSGGSGGSFFGSK